MDMQIGQSIGIRVGIGGVRCTYIYNLNLGFMHIQYSMNAETRCRMLMN